MLRCNLIFMLLVYHMGHVLMDQGIDIDLRSFACDDQAPKGVNNNCNRASAKSWIKINGKAEKTIALGWNIVVIDHHTGRIEDRRTFDTCGDFEANRVMTNFILKLPKKKILLGVAHDDVGNKLLQYTLKELDTVAGKGFKRIFRGATAFIGYKEDIGIRQRVLCNRYEGPAIIKVTIGKLPHGKVLQFNLQSLGYTDSGPLFFNNMVAKTWISYKKEHLVGLLGLNIMVINYQTEAVVAKRHFCTHCTNTISFLAHSFLKQLRPNMIVLGVVHSDWTKKASPALKALLGKITRSSVQTKYDNGWAFVGYTGPTLPSKGFTISRFPYPKDKIGTKYTQPIRIHYFTKGPDEDECKTGKAKCGANTLCRNTKGSYACDCKHGFVKKGNQCIDVDECKEGTAFCGTRATCHNKPGSYTCSCKRTKALDAMGFFCKQMSLQVISTACYYDTINHRSYCEKKPIQVMKNGKNILPSPVKGFNIIVMNSQTGAVEDTQGFKTQYSLPESDRLVRYLNGLAKYKIVIGAVEAGHTGKIASGLPAAIERITGIKAKLAGFKGTFAFIGYSGPGLPTWTRSKSTTLMKGSVIVEARFWLLPKPPAVPIRLVSLGYARGKSVPPSLGFMHANYAKLLKPGFNIAVLNDWTGSIEMIGQFNTHDKTSPDVRKMEQFLNGLSVDRIVIGIVKGDAYKGIQANKNIKKAMERILGAPMKLQSVGASYAFIGSTYTGRKQRPPYVEQVSFQAGKGQAMLSPVIGLNWKPTALKINLVSTGCNDPGKHKTPKLQCFRAKNSINVNGQELSLNGRGINVAVVNRVNGHVLHRKRFDTAKSASECTKMADFINSLPKTSIVLGVVKDDAHKYFHSNKHLQIAMKSILGASVKPFVPRGSFAFIGYKGKVKHIWVNQKYALNGKGGTSLSATIKIKPEINIELLSTACSDPHAGPCHANKNHIKVNGKEYSKSGRGFNIVTIDIETGDVEERRAFDTWKDQSNSKNMEMFLTKIPAHRIVLGVIKDEAYTNLRDGAKKAIATLLHKKSISFKGIRESYVFIGYTSMQPFKWIQEKGALKGKGPTKLKIGVPMPQAGCVFPKAPLNGKIKRIEYDISQSADYKCNKGLVLFGKPQTCNKKGKWTGSLPRCLDEDECKTGKAKCGANTLCRNTRGSYACNCKPGYVKKGDHCIDDDECYTGMANCGMNAHCRNTKGSYVCDCRPGFVKKDNHCIDEDECYNGKGKCDANTQCRNTQGSYTCDCKSGFTKMDDQCIDANECENGKANCGANSLCWNTIGSYTCHCEHGFVKKDNRCIDRNECHTGRAKCGANSFCRNVRGSYVCDCNPGYVKKDNQCRGEDGCDVGRAKCGVNSVCRNVRGSFVCDCKPGFVKKDDQCIDENECETGKANCGTNTICRNTEGSYFCDCRERCADKDDDVIDENECETGKAKCGANTLCRNTKHSYACNCLPGFVEKDNQCIEPRKKTNVPIGAAADTLFSSAVQAHSFFTSCLLLLPACLISWNFIDLLGN